MLNTHLRPIKSNNNSVQIIPTSPLASKIVLRSNKLSADGDRFSLPPKKYVSKLLVGKSME